ncbi:hypothetical protein [Leclercia adecarboxylata]|uniref:hypothetical protein n=1 Tax=Leclercia adecarboxylata TaxID=83655 RepID=UPI0013DF70F5|nr:hypothetical protein [Leclercia adecarboxylata]QIG27561.1 hypothetical protein FY044_04465 [Leclercia adecarboxylata]
MDIEQFDSDIYRLDIVQIFDKYPHIDFKVFREPTDVISLPNGLEWTCECGCGVVTPGYWTVGSAYTADHNGNVFSCSLELGLASPCVKNSGEHFGISVFEEGA